jgi:cysteine synthase
MSESKKFGVLDLIGNTPMVDVSEFNQFRVLAKCELYNPTGSHKDRVYYHMIKQLEYKDEIRPGMTLIDCSTGNGGAALSMIGSLLGYNVIIVMSEERIRQIESYGGKIIYSPSSEFLLGASKIAHELQAKSNGCYFFLDQSNNMLNHLAWRECGREIVSFCVVNNIRPTHFICSIGTGATFSGICHELKNKFPDLISVGVEVEKSSPLFAKRKKKVFRHRPHTLMGLGAGILAPNTVENLIDDVALVDERQSWNMMKEVIRNEKIMVGPTCGANIQAIRDYASNLDSDAVVITIFFDSSWKYYSVWEGKYKHY